VRLGDEDGLAPGELRVSKAGVAVGTASGALLLGTVQPPGKRPMPAADWARGARPEPGEHLG
jgi:Methionyl-tRNA formyltransferase